MEKDRKEYCRAILRNRDLKDQIIPLLESIGIACYDDDDPEDLLESAIDSYESGDIDLCIDFSLHEAKAHGGEVWQLWLEIDS